MAIGAKGIALSYVIWKEETPDPTVLQQWESMETLAGHHGGSAYNQDKLMVYNIIIRNIANGSDVYIYVNPHIKRDDERRDIKALQGQYENSAMHEQYVNEANRNLETVAYRNEWVIKF